MWTADCESNHHVTVSRLSGDPVGRWGAWARIASRREILHGLLPVEDVAQTAEDRMTRDEFLVWLREQQRPGATRVTPKPPSREPGDESEFTPVGTFADRLQASLQARNYAKPMTTWDE